MKPSTAGSIAYLNGRWLPAGELALPVHDAGFVLGATVTDLARTFRHQPYRLAEHVQRFRRSCTRARIPQPVPDDELTRLAEQLVEHNAALLPADADLAVVLFATPGPIGWYAGLPGGPGDGPPTLGLHTFPLPLARYRRLFSAGARLAAPATRRPPASSLDPTIKMRSRLYWWLAECAAQDREPGASALLLDTDGFVTETAAANLLIVKDGVVQTPPRSTVLPGVSLQVVEELCGQLAIPFEERRLTLAECRSADEAMLSCTTFCLAPVSRLDGADLTWPGPIYERLLRHWSDQVGLDIRGQILSSP